MAAVERVTLAVMVAALITGTAHAQDTKTVGISMAYPAAFGVVWHATDKVAIRPSITFAGSSTDTGSTVLGSASNWNIGTSVAALFYLKKIDNVRTYISPSYRYAHTSTTSHPPASSGFSGDSHSTGDTNGAAGTFGAEFAPNSRFRIIGEIGVAVSHVKSISGTSGITSSGNSWGTTAGVGIVFYP